MDISTERLMVLTKEGDAQAALTLRARAKRTNDEGLMDFILGAIQLNEQRLLDELDLWKSVRLDFIPFAVVLRRCGPKKIQVIKEIRAITKRGLKEAKAVADNTPSLILIDAEVGAAERYAERIRSVGAEVAVLRSGELSSQVLWRDGWGDPKVGTTYG